MGCGSSTPTGSRSSGNLNSRQQGASSFGVVSRPLEDPKSYRHGAIITQGELNNLRADFWSSRVEGDSIMWQAIRSAAEALLVKDLILANAILEASNISTPNACLDVCYDERGQQYKVPLFCYCNPVELTNEPATLASGGGDFIPNASNSHITGTPIKIRIRINPGDINASLDMTTGQTIWDLKSKLIDYVHKHNLGCDISLERQRVIFMGKEMQNKTNIADAGMDDTKVVQVFLRPMK